MSTVNHAVIAAAGFGSRLGRGHPKCLVDFRGRTLLDRQLELLRHVPDVRIVVGFQEELVVAHARELRPDIIIVRNPAYSSTTTLDSYALGARFLSEPCLFMDADIVFEGASFRNFVAEAAATGAPLIAYTDAKTTDAVFCEIDGDVVTSFSRGRPSAFEWANLAYLSASYCEGRTGSVYGRLTEDLPMQARHITSHEIDRAADLEVALRDHPLEEVADHQGRVAHGLAAAAFKRSGISPGQHSPGAAVR